MTTLGWLCIAFGVFVAGVILFVCIYDPWAIASGHVTVSRETLRQSWKHPALVALVTGLLLFPSGILVGHLFFPQWVSTEVEEKLHRP